MVTSTWINLDDRASVVQYSEGNWHESEAASYGMTSTETCAESPGAVSINYDFWSVNVWAFYWPNTDVAQVTCTIDGDPLEVIPPPNTTSNPHTVWHWLVCGIEDLAWKNHTVQITVTDANHTKPFCLDRFAITTGHTSQLLESGLANSSTATLGGDSAGKRSPVGAIVGGTIGGLILLLLICGSIFWWWRHRKEQHRYTRTMDGDHDFDRMSVRENSVQSFFRRTLGLNKSRRKAASWLEPVRPSVRPVSLLRAPSRVPPGHDQGLHVVPHPADPHHAASLPASLIHEKSGSPQDLEFDDPLVPDTGNGRESLISPRLPRSESPQPLPQPTSPRPPGSPTVSPPPRLL